MQRVVQGRSATLTRTFTSDGVVVAPTGTPTVTITRADGTPVVTNFAATSGTDNAWTYTLTPAQTALLDRLTVVWTATVAGYAQTFKDTVEVAGDVLFSLGEFRQSDPSTFNTAQAITRYPNDRITAVRTRAEQALEEACGVAFVPRYTREAISGRGDHSVTLSQPMVRRIRSVSTSTLGVVTPYSESDVALTAFTPSGIIYSPNRITAGYGNVTVGYEHGHDFAPERVRYAALLLAKKWLVSGPIDDRSTSMSSEDGTFLLSTPGMRGATFGIPEVDAVVQQYGMRVSVA